MTTATEQDPAVKRLWTTTDAPYRISFNPLLPISDGSFDWQEFDNSHHAAEGIKTAYEQALHLAQKGNWIQRLLATALLRHPRGLALATVEVFLEGPNDWFRVS